MNCILVVGGGCSEVLLLHLRGRHSPQWETGNSLCPEVVYAILIFWYKIKIHFAWLWLQIHGVMCSCLSSHLARSCNYDLEFRSVIVKITILLNL